MSLCFPMLYLATVQTSELRRTRQTSTVAWLCLPLSPTPLLSFTLPQRLRPAHLKLSNDTPPSHRIASHRDSSSDTCISRLGTAMRRCSNEDPEPVCFIVHSRSESDAHHLRVTSHIIHPGPRCTEEPQTVYCTSLRVQSHVTRAQHGSKDRTDPAAQSIVRHADNLGPAIQVL